MPNMVRGKGSRGRGGRGASNSKVGTRANPIAMEVSGANEETERQLTPSSGSGGARAGDEGAAGGAKESRRTNLTRRKIGDLRVSPFGRAKFPNRSIRPNMCRNSFPPIQKRYMVW